MIFKRIKAEIDSASEECNAIQSDEQYEYLQIKVNNFELNSKKNMLIQMID